jgi:epoxyqueuosine reductase
MSLRSPTEIKAGLRRFAAEIGFDVCRVAQAGEPRHASEFRKWLEGGSAADMDWIQRGAEKRCDPQNVLPGARSIVVLAKNYWQGQPPSPNDGGGRIARYAWGNDYHGVVGTKLRSWTAFSSRPVGIKVLRRPGPVLERFAAEAGIGWHGKSNYRSIANSAPGFPRGNSHDAGLPPDPPQVARCGPARAASTPARPAQSPRRTISTPAAAFLT